MRTVQCSVLALVCLLTACSKPDPRAEAFAKLPDWRGIWIAEGHDAGISGFSASGGPDAMVFKLIDPKAPWTDAARARMLELLNNSGARKAQGWGYPMMMDAFAPIQFVINPDEV